MKDLKQIKKMIKGVSAVMIALSLFVGCDTKMADAMKKTTNPNAGHTATPPTVVLSNLSGGQHVQGGTVQKITFIATDLLGFDANKMEYSADGGVTWQLAVSATNPAVSYSTYFPSLSGKQTSFDWQVPSQVEQGTGLCGASKTTDSSTYLVRITTTGRPDADSATAQSAAVFTVDSCPPVLAASGFTNLATYNHGFAQFQLASVADMFNLSPVTHVCAKQSATTTAPAAPSVTDSCWAPVSGLGTTPSASSTTVTIPYFIGYSAGTYYLSLWAKDAASNMTILSSTSATDALTVAYTCASTNCSSLSYATLACYNTATGAYINKTDAPTAGSNTTVLDPGFFVVTSDGKIYARDKNLGIVKIDFLGNAATTMIANTGVITDGNIGTATVKKPLRLALDSSENLIIFDYDRIRRVNLHATTPSVETIVGGGAVTTDTVVNPLSLQITYHDNLLWYGTFAVLPNDYIVFNDVNPNAALGASVLSTTGTVTGGTPCISSPGSTAGLAVGQIIKDTTTSTNISEGTVIAALPGICATGEVQMSTDAVADGVANSITFSGTRFLRVYQPDQTNKVVSMYFGGTGVYGNTSQTISGLYPYGAMGVVFNKTTSAISNFYSRVCDTGTTCTPQVAALFDANGVATTTTATDTPDIPSSWSNGTYFVSRNGDLWAMNTYAGQVYKLNTTTNTWDVKLGAGVGAGCTDGSLATSFGCTINLWDAYVGLSDVLYFVDNGKIRFVDSVGRVKTLVQ